MSTRKSDTDTHAKSKNRGKERIEIQRNLPQYYTFYRLLYSQMLMHRYINKRHDLRINQKTRESHMLQDSAMLDGKNKKYYIRRSIIQICQST